MNILGRKTTKQQVKASQRDVNNNIRELEVELKGLQREEVILTADIRAAAKNGNEAGTRVLAKQLVRLREHKIQLQMTMAGLRGVRNTLSMAATSRTMEASMQKAGKALAAVGSKVDPLETQRQMKQFAKENDRHTTAQSLVDEGIESALDSEEIDVESNILMQQVLDEVGLNFASKMQSAPVGTSLTEPTVQLEQEDDADDELMRHLAALKV